MTNKTLAEHGWINAGVWLPPELARRLHKVAPPIRDGRAASGRSAFIRRAIEAELDRIENAPCEVCGRAKVPALYGDVTDLVCPDHSDWLQVAEWEAKHGK